MEPCFSANHMELLTFFDHGCLLGSARSGVRKTMARQRKDLGARKHVRVALRKPGFLIPAPEAPWIECQILDVSDRGACLEVGALAVPTIFGLAFTADGRGVSGVPAGLAPGRTDRCPLRVSQGAPAGPGICRRRSRGSEGTRRLRPAKPAARIIAPVAVRRAACRSSD